MEKYTLLCQRDVNFIFRCMTPDNFHWNDKR